MRLIKVLSFLELEGQRCGIIMGVTCLFLLGPFQSFSIIKIISVISSKFINKFVQKCQHYYTLSDQIIPLVTVTSVVSLLTELPCHLCTKISKRPKHFSGQCKGYKLVNPYLAMALLSIPFNKLPCNV